MEVLVLDSTSKKITAVLAGSVATTEPDYTAHYVDYVATPTTTYGSSDGVLNGTTPVDIVASPGASTQRLIKYLGIFNRDTADITLTLNYHDGSSDRVIWKGTLHTLQRMDTTGSFDANGALQTAIATIPVHGHVDNNTGGKLDLSAAVSGGPLAASFGGLGVNSPTAHSLVVANGASAVNLLAPGTARNIAVSDGTDWTSRAMQDADIPTALAGHTLTGGSVNNTPIGATTANTLIASAISLLIGGFKAIFTHANSADRTYTLPDYNATLATIAGSENLTNKTLTNPTISGGNANNMTVGSVTPSSGIFSALKVSLGGFLGIFTHSNSADRTYTLPNKDGTVAMLADIIAALNVRLSLSSTLPVSGDIAASDDLYVLPRYGNKFTDGAGANYTLADAGIHLTASGASLLPAYCYDVFSFITGGALSAEFLAWNAPTNAAITAISNANPPVVSTATTPTTDQIVVITGAAGAGAAAINKIRFRVGTVSAGVSFQLLALDGTNPGAPGVITGSTGTWFRYDAAQTRATAIDYANGLYYKHGDTTRVYLGSVKMDEAGKFNDTSAGRRLLWNYFNRVEGTLKAVEATVSWNYTTATWRAVRNSLANRVEMMVGVQEDPAFATVHTINSDASTAWASGGVGVNSITVSSIITMGGGSSTTFGATESQWQDYLSAGYNYLQWLEISDNVGTQTFYGTHGLTYIQSGITARMLR